jgi:hypothetical protein
MRLPRPVYIAARTVEAVGAAMSRLINSALLGGSTHQTVSARAHITPEWATARAWINRVFFWQADHCEWAWRAEVASAIKTLDRAGLPCLPPPDNCKDRASA